jgi:hypothetical protein
MNRSRTQIATSYAPGALFTYEGGLGCCVAVPMSTPKSYSAAVQKQLFEHLAEFVESWFERAIHCRQQPQILPEQCVDADFLDYKNEPHVDSGRFTLNQPSRIGFMPDPLVFKCSECGRLTEFANVEDLSRRWPETERRVDCRPPGSRHDWRQLDVVFAHWSGTYCGLSPYRVVLGPSGNASPIKRCANCGYEEYQLVTKSSPFFSDWRFQCVNCLADKEVVQADRETLELLKPQMDAGSGNVAGEWNMLPVSYRASQVFYVQKDSFILFQDTEVMTLLGSARRGDLIARLMKLYAFPGVVLTDEEIMRQLEANGRAIEARDYRQLFELLGFLPAGQAEVIRKQLSEKRAQFETKGLIATQREQSPRLAAQVDSCQAWARRYNPIRLAMEHASLRSEVVDRQGSDPSLPAISVLNPDVCDISAGEVKARQSYVSGCQAAMTQLGFDEMALLRKLDICEFSFGYTRVASTPSTEIKERQMPVRLRAFRYVEKSKRPIYVLEQKNEGFYIRLNETRVIAWLEANGLGSLLPPRGGMRLGGLLIDEYVDFLRFLDDYKERTAESRTRRSIPNYVYLLLHTMAHHFAQAVVEYSGLEYGSLGEYLFPADLAFIVYRRGMTPDLANLSAMWRNHGVTVLGHLLWDRALKCDAGSLCDQRRGACPACIMAPEVTCLTGNNLLSRAVLNGGPPPDWDLDRSPMTGFLRIPA